MEFDWYSASLQRADPSEVLAAITEGEDLVDVVPCRALNGYQRAAKVQRGSEVLGTVQWGGNGESIHAFGSGSAAPKLAGVIRSAFPAHRVTRADVREDYDSPEAWVGLYDVALGVAKEFGVQARYIGPPPGEDVPEQGRTLYVGSRKSPVQLRVYEKGRQLPEYKRPSWVRSELMVLPAKVAQREAFATVAPAAFFGASRWSKEYLERLSGCEVARISAGTVYRKEDDERAEHFLLRQWGGFLERKAGQLGGWDLLGTYLGEKVLAAKEEAVAASEGEGRGEA